MLSTLGVFGSNFQADSVSSDTREATLSSRGMGGAGPSGDSRGGQGVHGGSGGETARTGHRPEPDQCSGSDQPTGDHCRLGQEHGQTFLQRHR